jgi:hypothetical protein
MGIQPASNELSHQMQHVFHELFAAESVTTGSPMVRDLDDFLGGAETVEGLAHLIEEFLNRCQAGGVYLNPSKFQIAVERESVIFAGVKVSSEGYKMDPGSLESIRQFKRPTTNKQLQR